MATDHATTDPTMTDVPSPETRGSMSRRSHLRPRTVDLAKLLLFLSYSSPISAYLPPSSSLRRCCWLAAERPSLESLTVKELRSMVKEATKERGILSTLKRKQDLIDYLASNNGHDTEESPTHEEEPPRRERAPKMPSTDLKEPKFTSPKDAIIEEVYQRYPPLRDIEETDADEVDVRQLYHPMLQHTSPTDMDLVFVGTASCMPGTTRGVSCTALRLNWRRRAKLGDGTEMSDFTGGTWLFDVGECTQLQIQRTSAIKPSKITKIFLTHAHGDHSFGLPGLLCLMGQDRDRTGPPIEIYGPEGLRMWLRVAIRYSVSRIVPNYRVHEIMNVPMAPEWELSARHRRYFYRGRGPTTRSWGEQGLAGEDPHNWISQANQLNLQPSALYGEVGGGRNIYPIYNHDLSHDGAPVWEVEDEGDVRVYAAPMSHGIPCLGFVVEELPRAGRLRNELVEPIVKRNLDALKEAGFQHPMKALAVVKNLAPGTAFTFPDGTVVRQEDAVEPQRPGRKVVLCGDTANSRALRRLAEHADVVVHEATNTYLPGVDKETTLRDVTRDAVIHGHSTPFIAGDFAREVGAKRLVLNHFSARYKGDTSLDSMSIMMRMERQAMKASRLNETQVAAAWDLMVLPIPQE